MRVDKLLGDLETIKETLEFIEATQDLSSPSSSYYGWKRPKIPGHSHGNAYGNIYQRRRRWDIVG